MRPGTTTDTIVPRAVRIGATRRTKIETVSERPRAATTQKTVAVVPGTGKDAISTATNATANRGAGNMSTTATTIAAGTPSRDTMNAIPVRAIAVRDTPITGHMMPTEVRIMTTDEVRIMWPGIPITNLTAVTMRSVTGIAAASGLIARAMPVHITTVMPGITVTMITVRSIRAVTSAGMVVEIPTPLPIIVTTIMGAGIIAASTISASTMVIAATVPVRIRRACATIAARSGVTAAKASACRSFTAGSAVSG